MTSLLLITASILALLGPSIGSNLRFLNGALGVLEFFGRTVFIFLLLEAGITFFRLLRRLRYLFGKVRESAATT